MLKFIQGLFGLAIFVTLSAFIFMVCWGVLAPVFGIVTLSFGKSLVAIVLIRIIGTAFGLKASDIKNTVQNKAG